MASLPTQLALRPRLPSPVVSGLGRDPTESNKVTLVSRAIVNSVSKPPASFLR